MDWNRYIHLQCERSAPGLFGEPFNTLTGLAFFVVAYCLWNFLQKQPAKPFSLKFLVIMVAMVGCGSMTYHSVSRMWAAVFADVLPIAILACVFFYMLTKHILRLHLIGGLVLLAIFVAVNLWYRFNHGRGPDGYVSLMPSLLMMFLISIYMFFTKNPSFINFSLAAITAAIAITFRIMDNYSFVCDNFPMGTHWVWHILMAVFFYLVIRETIKRHRVYDRPGT